MALAKKLHRPDVVLMDIAMPLLNGLEATRQVLKAVPATKVLMLSAHSDDAYVKNATDSGAVGFLLKQTSAHEVCRADPRSSKGENIFQPRPFPSASTALNPPSLGPHGDGSTRKSPN